MRPELVFLIDFCLLGTQNCCIVKIIFRVKKIIEKMLIRTKITLKVNKSEEPSIPCSRETLNLDNSSKKKNEIQNNLSSFEFYAGRAF